MISVLAAAMLATAPCAQDVIDHKIGGVVGVTMAADALMRGDHTACERFERTEKPANASRQEQLVALSALKGKLPANVYFFLRGTVRPLIACTANQFHRNCESATGKRWAEVRIGGQGNDNKITYRLGHSENGPIVDGPQDAFTEEDREYLASLPKDFVGTAATDLPNEMQRHFRNLKVLALARTDKFIKHYFSAP